jgi:hypothetical protein
LRMLWDWKHTKTVINLLLRSRDQFVKTTAFAFPVLPDVSIKTATSSEPF